MKNTPAWAGEADARRRPLGYPSGPGKSRSACSWFCPIPLLPEDAGRGRQSPGN